jgi:hypothetical protein
MIELEILRMVWILRLGRWRHCALTLCCIVLCQSSQSGSLKVLYDYDYDYDYDHDYLFTFPHQEPNPSITEVTNDE